MPVDVSTQKRQLANQPTQLHANPTVEQRLTIGTRNAKEKQDPRPSKI